MPATGMRFKMLFRDNFLDFTESHTLPTVNDFAAAQILALQLLAARHAINSPPVAIVSAELSQIGHFRRVLTLDPATFGTMPTFSYTGGTSVYQAGQANSADQTKACLLCHGYSGVDHRKSIFLAGVPDAILGEGRASANLDAIPGWRAAFNTYANILTTKGWGFVVRRGDAEGNGLADIQAVFKTPPDSRAQIAVDAGDIAVGVGDVVQVMGSTRDNVAYAPLNGIWSVDAVIPNSPVAGQTAITLRGTDAVAVGQLRKYGGVRLLDYTGVLYTQITIQGQTTRKRGNRSLASPGRRRLIKRI